MNKTPPFLSLFFFFILTTVATAQNFEENFPYTVGTALNGNGGWSGNPFVTVQAGDLALGSYPLSGGNSVQLKSTPFPSNISVQALPANVTLGSVYLACLIRTPADANDLPSAAFIDYHVGLTPLVFDNANLVGFGFFKNEDGQIQAQLYASVVNTIEIPGILATNTTYHVVLRYDFLPGNNLKVYISDTFMATEPASPSAQLNSGILVGIGSLVMRGYNNIPNGELIVDNFRLGSGWNGNGLLPLPVELTEFSAKNDNGSVCLEWTTASETDNDFFEIERSADGRSFSSIGKVTGAGTTLQSSDYTFQDSAPAPGLNYYRLRQIDLDGSFTFSNIISIQMAPAFGNRFSVHPNPGPGLARIRPTAGQLPENASIVVFDQQGKKVNARISASTDVAVIDLENPVPGTYYVQLTTDRERTVQQMVVTKLK